MCFTIYFICPGCRVRCGFTETLLDHHDKLRGCPRAVEVERWMRAGHFRPDWFCSTVSCGYSKKSQESDDAEEQAILAELLAELGVVDCLPATAEGSSTRGDYSKNHSGRDGACSPRKDNADQMEVDHDLGNGDSLPTSPPSHPPAQRTIGPGASFDLATTARIEDLCDKISCLSNDRINRWHPAEEELLRILRAHKVPYQDITPRYLPRHSQNACESQLARLKKRL